MADKSQRTEHPTPKHRKEVREKGKVARSQEIGGWASLLVVASLLPKLGGLAADRVAGFLRLVAQSVAHPSTAVAIGVLAKGLGTAAIAALPIVLVCTGVGVGAAFAQVGFRFTPKALRVQFSRISPKAGFGRIFSTQGAWSLGKTLVKLCLLAGLGYMLVHQLMGSVLGGATLPLPTTLALAGGSTSALLRDVGALALLVAGADYAFQRRTYQQGLRMTKQEIRDEYRRTEGSPEVRRALRGKARRLSRMRMMAAVASADVVVTNPTHFAVAHRVRPEEGPRTQSGGQRRGPGRRPDPGPRRASTAYRSSRTRRSPGRCTRPARSTTSSRPRCTWRSPGCWPSCIRSRPPQSCSATCTGWLLRPWPWRADAMRAPPLNSARRRSVVRSAVRGQDGRDVSRDGVSEAAGEEWRT